jgi:hypothetical protein
MAQDTSMIRLGSRQDRARWLLEGIELIRLATEGDITDEAVEIRRIAKELLAFAKGYLK